MATTSGKQDKRRVEDKMLDLAEDKTLMTTATGWPPESRRERKPRHRRVKSQAVRSG